MKSRADQTQEATAIANQERYTVTIYAALPGTVLRDDKGAEKGVSTAGHMFYSINDGTGEKGYGFSPIKEGTAFGRGQVVRDEQQKYRDLYYSRTMEISKQQYETLHAFGEEATQGKVKGFSLFYSGPDNSCIDFAWTALNKAGLHARSKDKTDESKSNSEPDFDGEIKVQDNIPWIRGIKSPKPQSPLNGETWNAKPAEKTLDWKQRTLTEAERDDAPVIAGSTRNTDARDPSNAAYMLDQQVRAKVLDAEHRLNRAWDHDSEKLSANLTRAALKAGFGAEDQLRIGFSAGNAQCAAGEYAFLQRVGSSGSVDPFANRAHVRVADALDSNVEQVYQQVEQTRQQQALARHNDIPAPDLPQRSGPAMG